MKKLENLKLTSETIMNDEEMKSLKGGFDCGGGQTYYTGSCTNGSGFSICASNYGSAYNQASSFCNSFGTGTGY